MLVKACVGMQVWMCGCVYRTAPGGLLVHPRGDANGLALSLSCFRACLILSTLALCPQQMGEGLGLLLPSPSQPASPGESIWGGEILEGAMRGVPGTPRAPLEESAEAALPV